MTTWSKQFQDIEELPELRTWALALKLEEIYSEVKFGIVNNGVFITNDSHYRLSQTNKALYLPFICNDLKISANCLAL